MVKYTLHFHSALWKLTENHKFCIIEADSYLDLVRNCINLFPKLRQATPKLKNQSGEELWLIVGKKILPIEKLIMPPSEDEEIYLVPLLYGNNKIGMIIIGVILIVAIIALTIVTAGGALAAAGAAGTVAAEAGAIGFGAGLSATAAGSIGAGLGATAAGTLTFMEVTQLVGLALSVISTILKYALAPKRNVSDGSFRKDNDAFGSFENKTAINSPIPLNYGMIRVPGQFVNGYIKTINHGRDDIIKVSSYVQ